MKNQKGISSLIGIVIIILLAVIAVGGIFAYQYLLTSKGKIVTQIETNTNNQNIKQTPQVTQYDFSKLDKDNLLHKLFSNLYFQNGVADLSKDSFFGGNANLNLYLKKSVEDYFVNNNEKNLLLIAQLDGVPHVGGLYHAYLGLFDQNGNLLTPSSTFPKLNLEFDLYQDKTQFGGDAGNFGFYNCKGIKYILFVSSGCPNSTCCSDVASLFRINNGNFEKIQTINYQSLAKTNNNFLQFIQTANAATGSGYGLKMILSDDKILVKKVPNLSDNGCSETNYKELKWNTNSCRFE